MYLERCLSIGTPHDVGAVLFDPPIVLLYDGTYRGRSCPMGVQFALFKLPSWAV